MWGQTPSSVRKYLLFLRTDEDVCPYRFVSFPFKEGVPLYQREAFFIAKKRPLQSEEGVSLFLVLLLQLTIHRLAILKLYYTSIPAKPYFKQK